jgi:hypothetical protein
MSLAKILKNCPKGMKLYSPIYGEVEFVELSVITGSIGCKANGCTVYFHSDGTYYKGGECMLFPSKEQRDWDDFMIPFRDGDIIIRTEYNPGCKQYNIAIFRNYNANPTNKMTIHCQVNGANEFKTGMCVYHKDWRLANSEEVKRFFTRMHESGHDFRDGKLITLPKFKVGDTITNGTYTFKISRIGDWHYYEDVGTTVNRLRIQEQDNWRIKKFDIHSLKPYDKVLVKNGDGCWYPSLVSYVNSSGSVCIIDATYIADYAIPFEGNEHLIGKFDDPDPYYITWQE